MKRAMPLFFPGFTPVNTCEEHLAALAVFLYGARLFGV